MDKPGFDGLARRLSVIRLDRAAALRGIGGASLAALLAVTLEVDNARANGKQKPNTKPICLCPSGDPAGCHTAQIGAKKARNKAKAKCNYKGRCQRGVVAARCRCGGGAPCRVFVTSSEHNGNLGGLAGADAICQGLAEGANLPGTYKAWLSDSAGSPSTRFVRSPGPYVLVDGTTIANDWADLTLCDAAAPFACLAHAIDQTETGSNIGLQTVWTHTRTDGTAGGFMDLHCQDWSSAQGLGDIADTAYSDQLWTFAGTGVCAAPRPLYCFQQR